MFEEYYRQHFQSDIQRFMMSIPPESRNHEQDKSIFTIQYERLTKDTPHLDTIAPEFRAHFAIALFLSVLVDEVCYTHFKPFYTRFRLLTQYPKFIGNCPGGCHYHFHPREIFAAINYSRDGRNSNKRPNVSVSEAFNESSDVMKEEIFDFFNRQLPEVSPSEFWKRCVIEFPYRTKHDIKASNSDVVERPSSG